MDACVVGCCDEVGDGVGDCVAEGTGNFGSNTGIIDGRVGSE